MRRGVNLKAKLDAYEASSAVGSGAAAKKRQRTWPVYAAAAGSGLAMATSAEAGIVYSGPQNVTLTPAMDAGSASHSINIDGHGHNFVVGGFRRGWLLYTRLAVFAARGSGRSRGTSSAVNGVVSLKHLASAEDLRTGRGLIPTAPVTDPLFAEECDDRSEPPDLLNWGHGLRVTWASRWVQVHVGGLRVTSAGSGWSGKVGRSATATGIPTTDDGPRLGV